MLQKQPPGRARGQVRVPAAVSCPSTPRMRRKQDGLRSVWGRRSGADTRRYATPASPDQASGLLPLGLTGQRARWGHQGLQNQQPKQQAKEPQDDSWTVHSWAPHLSSDTSPKPEAQAGTALKGRPKDIRFGPPSELGVVTAEHSLVTSAEA